ncbi:MAG TPA: hypothetical protein VKR60_03405 [Candidatus Sulfotelmatobacter sp.]|nr:hypothetical protein [Candidatus Sulfotelmatobacter sp.]
MRRLLPMLCILALIAVFTALNAPEADGQANSTTPAITGALEGSRVAVFETPQDSCVQDDIPDAMARAFRDSTGTIHFVSASSDMFQSLGPTLDSLVHSCEPAFISSNDANPADFNDQVWLDSFYTLDGNNIAALSHTEYHGWSHPGECNTKNIIRCEYDSDTYHLSKDGGYHFDSFRAPKNFLAGVPYKYALDWGPAGYSVDTNIVEFGGWYYAVATDWTWPPNCSGNTGPHRCLVPTGGAPIRTTNVFDPSSWRGWNGTDFSLTFVDPYLGPVSHPEDHVYTPVPYMGFVNAINVYKSANVIVATLWDYWDNELGPPGLYLTTSTDLVHWTKPRLVVTVAELSENDPPGSWLYAYFSLIDAEAPDLNFSVIGDHPYLYYVRLDNNDALHRVLFRQKVKLTLH